MMSLHSLITTTIEIQISQLSTNTVLTKELSIIGTRLEKQEAFLHPSSMISTLDPAVALLFLDTNTSSMRNGQLALKISTTAVFAQIQHSPLLQAKRAHQRFPRVWWSKTLTNQILLLQEWLEALQLILDPLQLLVCSSKKGLVLPEKMNKMCVQVLIAKLSNSNTYLKMGKYM